MYQARNLLGNGPGLLGIDVDGLSVLFANLLSDGLKLYAELVNSEKHLMSTPQHGRLIFDTDPSEFLGEIDILIGNPPFVRSQLLNKEYANSLRNSTRRSLKGISILSILFLEQALRSLAPGGIASYILSNKFMVSSYGAAICKKLASEARIVCIEDFHDLQLFSSKTTYTCVLTIAKLAPAKRFTVIRYLGTDDNGIPNSKRSSTLPYERLIEHPWEFTSGIEQEILRKRRDPIAR